MVSIRAIKRFLIKNILELEIRLEELEDNYQELQIKNQLIKKLEQLMEKYNIHSYNIELELTEDIIVADVDKAVKVMKGLKDLGIRISIDDFGTGYSSLQYVYELPIDTIKIDKHFADNIIGDPKMQAIVKAIINIAEAGNYEVIAEDVESIEQVKVLEELGCHLIQGYYYSKPSKLTP